MTARVLLVDDAAAMVELFGAAIAARLEVEVEVVVALADVADALAAARFDLAIVDLSFPQENATGIDALAEIHFTEPSTILTVATQGDRWIRPILRDACELLPVATVLSKSAPLDYQLGMIERVLAGERVAPDPAITAMLPRVSTTRTYESLRLLLPHHGHIKVWRALLAADDDVTYAAIVERTGLRLNTIKNYRAQLLPALRMHGLEDPSLKEMQQFAWRCRALLTRAIAACEGLDGS